MPPGLRFRGSNACRSTADKRGYVRYLMCNRKRLLLSGAGADLCNLWRWLSGCSTDCPNNVSNLRGELSLRELLEESWVAEARAVLGLQPGPNRPQELLARDDGQSAVQGAPMTVDECAGLSVRLWDWRKGAR